MAHIFGKLLSAGNVLYLDLRGDYTDVPFVKIHHLCIQLCTLLYVCYTEIKGLFKKLKGEVLRMSSFIYIRIITSIKIVCIKWVLVRT